LTSVNAGLYTQAEGGTHAWYTAPSGTINTAISFTQAMTLDADGDLVVGGTSADARFTAIGSSASSIVTVATLQNPVNAAGTGHGARLILHSTADTNRGVAIASSSSANYATDNAMLFYTSASSTLTERARITSGGYFKASDTGSYAGATASYHELISSGTSPVHIINSNASGPNGIYQKFTNAAPDNNTQYFLYCEDSTNTARVILYSDGDGQNHDNSWGGISDERLKQDIVDANSQWDDIKSLRVRKYRFKSDVEEGKEHAQIGLIAQEVLDVSPGLVTGSEDTQFGVQYSVLYMKAVKALQEAMTRIEQLEAKVAALESK
jgi:hypothetical protein